MNASEKQFSFTRAASSTCGRAKSKFLSVLKAKRPTALFSMVFVFMALHLSGADNGLDPLTAFHNSDALGIWRGKNDNTANAGRAFWLMFRVTSAVLREEVRTSTCEAIITNGFCILDVLPRYDHAPSFRRGEHASAYGQSGNLKVARTSRECLLFSRSRNEARKDFSYYIVRPDGVTIATNTSTLRSKYYVGDSNSLWLFEELCLSVGRGFDRYVERLTSHTNSTLNGLDVVDGVGRFRGPSLGAWTIKYSEALQYLVREAEFIPRASSSPTFTVNNDGVVECRGLLIAASGVMHTRATRSEFHILAITNVPVVDARLDGKLQQLLMYMDAETPKGGLQEMDWRGPVPKLLTH